ncbi:hypothetical protein ACFFYR_08935 [Paraburkholderia dipogonis]|uniref:hypothetical protein n=1 Tax=Paraburkholderia dipogonis TaxID=1211383 RepID=UPI0035EFEE7C
MLTAASSWRDDESFCARPGGASDAQMEAGEPVPWKNGTTRHADFISPMLGAIVGIESR